MSSNPVLSQLQQLVRLLYGLYSINTLVLLMALLIALAPTRPQFMNALDDSLYTFLASPSQLNLLKNERSLANAQSYDKMGLNDVAGSLASIFNGDAFRLSNTRDHLTPQAFHLVERIGLILIALFLMRGLRKVPERESLKYTGIAAISLLLVEASGLYFLNIWLPMGIAVQFLFAAYIIMLLQLKYELQASSIRSELEDVSYQFLQRLQPEYEPERVNEVLQNCAPDEATFTFAYDFAQSQAKAHRYHNALKAYKFVLTHNRRFKDVGDRVADVRAAIERKNSIRATGSVPIEATMVVESGVPVPSFGRYQVLRELGRGAMGTVYLGKDPKIAREVAIKTLSYQQFPESQLPELRERFFREAKAAGRLSHPNIVTVYDMGEEANLAYIAMDYIRGTALDAYCRIDNLLPIETVYSIILQVAEALSYAHKQKIIHRDIKPSNLIYSAETELVKVSDFGIARMSDESKTKTGQVLGSPVYMAPEQLKGSAVTGAADIFSLGATFYQLLTGSTPFRADSLPELTIKIMSKKHKSVRELRGELPASAVRITNKALNKDPNKRFADAEEMAVQLRKALMSDFKARVA